MAEGQGSAPRGGGSRGSFRKGPGRGGPRKRSNNMRPKTRRVLGECDYKDADFLSKFISEKGKILTRKITRLNAKDQRILTRTIKRSRHAGLLPFKASL